MIHKDTLNMHFGITEKVKKKRSLFLCCYSGSKNKVDWKYSIYGKIGITTVSGVLLYCWIFKITFKPIRNKTVGTTSQRKMA